MLIPETFIEQVRDRTDIVDVIGKRISLKKAGHEYKARCPFHNEKTPSFTVSPVKQFYHCFGCGAHGNAFQFLMEHDGMDFPDAVKTLAAEVGLAMPKEEPASNEERQRQAHEQALYQILETAQKYFIRSLKNSPVAIGYAKSRGLTGETAHRFGLGYAPPTGILSVFEGVPHKTLIDAGLLVVEEDSGEVREKFRKRLMFPIQDDRGHVIGFGGRVIGDGKPKYLNSPETAVFHKGSELYGIVQAKQAIRQSRQAVVLEGYMDVAMLHQHGEHRAVAALGTSLTEEQVRKLYRMADEIIFCFDGDAAGQKAAARSAEIVLGEIQDGKTAKFVALPAQHDPDSFVQAEGLEAWERLLDEQGLPLSAKLIEGLTEGADLTLPENRASIAKAAEEMIGKIENAPRFRQALAKHVESLLGLSLRDVPAKRIQRASGQGQTSQEQTRPRHKERSAQTIRSSTPEPDPNKHQLYCNLANLCALDYESIAKVPLEFLDLYANLIPAWFSEGQGESVDERYERLTHQPETAKSLRSYILLALQYERQIRAKGPDAVRAEIEGLLDAFDRMLDRRQRRSDFETLFGEDC